MIRIVSWRMDSERHDGGRQRDLSSSEPERGSEGSSKTDFIFLLEDMEVDAEISEAERFVPVVGEEEDLEAVLHAVCNDFAAFASGIAVCNVAIGDEAISAILHKNSQ